MRSINSIQKMKFDHVSKLCKSLHSSLRSSPQWFTAIPKDDASSRGVNCNQKHISADVNISRVCRYLFRTVWCVDSRAFAAQRSSRRKKHMREDKALIDNRPYALCTDGNAGDWMCCQTRGSLLSQDHLRTAVLSTKPTARTQNAPRTSKLKCDRLLKTSSADWSRVKVQRPRWKYVPVYLPVGPLPQKQISANDEPVCGSRPQKRKTERLSQVDAVLVWRLLHACVADSAEQEMELNVEEVNRSQRHHCSRLRGQLSFDRVCYKNLISHSYLVFVPWRYITCFTPV